MSLALAILCAAPAPAQTYTWTGANGTDFNNASQNYSSAFTFPTSGTLQLLTGAGPTANLPVLTSSATAGQIRLQVTGSQTGTFSFLSSAPAAVLSLTSGTAFSASGGFTPALVAPNLNLSGAGDQRFDVMGPTTFSGTISGGGAGRFLTVSVANIGASQPITFSNSGNTFDSAVVVAAYPSDSKSARLTRLNVTTLGMAGSASSLGSAGTIVLDSQAVLATATSAVPQSSDKSFEIRKASTFSGTFASYGGINAIPLGSNTSLSANGYANMPSLMLTGSIYTAAWGGSGTTSSTFYLGESGTVSGRITEAANHLLRVTSYGVALTNPNNTFSGGFQVATSSTTSVPVLGMIGQPSYLGSGSLIELSSNRGSVATGGRLIYTGTGETSNKTFQIANFDGTVGGIIDASGSGELVLSNTTPVALTFYSNFLGLSGSGLGRLDSWLADSGTLLFGVRKNGTGLWTLTGSNSATGSIQIQAGTLLFAKKMSLFGGGTSSWTKANLLTTSAGTATLGVGVGGADGLTTDDVTTLITNLSGDVSTGGMRSTSSWGFDTTNAGGTFTVADVIANTFTTGTFTGGGAIGVTKLGTGTLSLTGTNTFTRGVRIEGGVLTIGNASALGSGTGYLQIAGGTLDLGTLTVDRGGTGITATAGGLANGVISGTGGLTKTGTGTFRIDATGNTFTGATAIQEGVVEVAAIAGPGVASSLGAPLLASSTIALGNATTGGTFRYIGSASGTMTRTLNLAGSAGGSAGIEASGLGALVVPSNALTIAAGAKTLTLGGSGTAANTIGTIPDASGGLTVVKDGPGLWTLSAASSFSGQFSVRNGTVVATVDANQTTGAFGAASPLLTVLVGNSSAGASGTAAVLMAAGRTTNKVIDVQTGGGSQAVMLGSQGTGAAAEFANDLWLGRPVTLMAAAGGTATFSGAWKAAGGSGTAATVNVSIGANGSTGTVRLSSSVTTTGSVGVRFGTLDIADSRTLTATGIVGIDSGATLAGVGTVAATLGGAGFVAPGNSPGILTAQAVDPTGGLDFNFEFSGTAPTYGTGTASVNDVLRLTGSSAFTTLLSSSNAINVYLDVATLADGNTFRGGFFTDLASDFTSSIDDATYTYWVSGTGAGQTTYLTKTYVPLSTAYPSLLMDVTTVPDTATFAGGSPTSGQVMQFTVVVPEPGTLALAALGLGLGLAGYALRRRRAA